MIVCPVCKNSGGGVCQEFPTGSAFHAFECANCGRFNISLSAFHDVLTPDSLSALQRAALSHILRMGNANTTPPMIKSGWLSRFRETARLPTPAKQAVNLIRAIGDYVSQHGGGFFVEPSVVSLIGAFDMGSCHRLIQQLEEKRLVFNIGNDSRLNPAGGTMVGPVWDLSLDGWNQYEAEYRGKFATHTGFLAMKFGVAEHDQFANSVIKPAVKEGVGYELVDLRDVPRAGIIDNIMRAQIRDAAFVISDLTHDNHGAYWEAGFAEGLGKPVIYICERGKFETAKTHFDTNHCTTVLWSDSDKELFARELVATLRRSLNLFDGK